LQLTEDAAPIRRIATEEAFSIPEQYEAIRALATAGSDEPDLAMWRHFLGNSRPAFVDNLMDVDRQRLRTMDELGVGMQLLSLTSPGVQMFEAGLAAEIAETANDRLAETKARHPGRYAGLASFAPQDPKRAAREMERAITKLGLNGFVLNSHTNGEYLDEPKFRPILETAAGLGAAIYIHPRVPPKPIADFAVKYALESGHWGFQSDAALHLLRIMYSKAFDDFPNLRIVLGHMGEGLPYWLWRLDYWHRNGGRRPPLKKLPSDYIRENVTITTSGMDWAPTLKFCLEVLGPDNIMFAIDYPYQEAHLSVEFMDTVDIPEDVRAKIYHGNAERIFRIPPAPGIVATGRPEVA
jgi:2,3-dihydroxybenzoate decarboxylase/5-carboxyvanillate decarboxylase